MTPIDTKGCTRIQVVEVFTVSTLTAAGWVLLGTVEESRPELLTQNVFPPNSNQSYTVPVTEQVMKTVTLFILGLDEKSALVEADLKLKDSEAKVKDAEEKLGVEITTSETLGKKLKDTETSARASRDQATSLQERFSAAQERERSHLTQIQNLEARVEHLTQAFNMVAVKSTLAKQADNLEGTETPDDENSASTRFDRVDADA